MLILRNNYAGSFSGFFNRPWTQYQDGFGSPTCTSLYWIGLERLRVVSQVECRVRFDLQDQNGACHYAHYSNFSVGDSSTNYTLTIGGWSGDVEDAMARSNGQQFSTFDADHDANVRVNCASNFGGGFWYGMCGGVFITTSTTSRDFMWLNSSFVKLNAVEVSLLC